MKAFMFCCVLLMLLLGPALHPAQAQDGPPSLRLDEQMKDQSGTDTEATEEEEEKKEPLEYNVGKAVVFAQRDDEGTNLYIHDPDLEEPLQLTDDVLIQSFPVYSPNRRYIAFLALNTRDPEQERGISIRIIRADGMKEIVLYQAPINASVIGLSWSPDSAKLVFSEKRNDPVDAEKTQQFLTEHYEKIEELRQAHEDSGSDEKFVAPEVDLRKLWQAPKMYTLKVGGTISAPRQIGTGVNPVFMGRNKILFTHVAPSKDPKARRMDFQLATLSKPMAEPQLIGPVNTTMGVPSPDNQMIIFVKVFNGKRTQLWKMDANGENAAVITASRGNVANPTWDAEGEKIIVTREGRNKTKSVWSLTPEGGEVEKLFDGATGSLSSQFYIGKKVAPEPKPETEGQGTQQK